jgi:hypothetical protein
LDVVRKLSVDANGLQLVEKRVARALQHSLIVERRFLELKPHGTQTTVGVLPVEG